MVVSQVSELIKLAVVSLTKSVENIGFLLDNCFHYLSLMKQVLMKLKTQTMKSDYKPDNSKAAVKFLQKFLFMFSFQGKHEIQTL